ncbi:hypothetical protein E2562_024530 [Oryza meyeriana var. granulata]|uniref:Uncharacterized protein n=1 Tax=Oryza meyeriana var. granulata TaxID=110450 RepID=A0A6G1BNV3_9ORYZ|nr:hypothetical protein E2562_024530 [Oryza meyeriana var. granulata]
MAAASAMRDLASDPPESTLLRIGDEIAWSDVGGGVYDRDDSLKEDTNPKCLLRNHPAYSGSGSQRFSGNLKPTAAPIIGLSRKLGQGGGGGGGGCARRFHPPAIFPKKAKTGGGGRAPKAAVPEHEPGSPKVSCIGKVLSDGERARRHRRWSLDTRPGGGGGGGCCPGFGSLFVRRSRSRKNVVECVDHSPPPPPPPVAALRRREEKVVLMTEEEEAAAVATPGLGEMKRFVSGRRAADWAAEIEVDGHVARSGPL